MPGTCWFARDALSQLLREARRWRVRETGGALLGWRDRDNTVVARVLGPGPDARHGFRSFEPDGAWQNELGAEIYSESGRTIAYLGDWHTHPRGPARPSHQDRETAKIIATDKGFRTPTPLYAIAARRFGRRKRWELVMFEWHDGKLEEVPVRVFDLLRTAGSLRSPCG